MGSTAAIVSVLLLALVVVILTIMYYRRRVKLMKRDLYNRSVYYSDTRSQDDGGESPDVASIDLVVNQHQISLDHGEMLNNVRLNLNSQVNVLAAASSKPVKNTNIENGKLGRISPAPLS